MKCNECEQEFGAVENWGYFNLCQKCSKELREKIPNSPPSEISDVTIRKPKHIENAMYNTNTGETELKKMPTDGNIMRVINHEFIHFILHEITDLRYCYQYDRIKDEVDPYHSFE